MTSNFSFSHNVFYPMWRLFFSFQIHYKMSSAVCFNFNQSRILSSGNGSIKISATFKSKPISKFKTRLFTYPEVLSRSTHTHTHTPVFEVIRYLVQGQTCSGVFTLYCH